MVRRYARRYRRRTARPLKTVKYSAETFSSNIDVGEGVTDQGDITLVSAISQQGMRKAKNFTLRVLTNAGLPFIWALVYVPQGTSAQPLQTPGAQAGSLYEPNQNVIMSGFARSAAPQETYRSRLARNLNSGDAIVFIYKPLFPPQAEFSIHVTLNYAITY